MMKTKNVFEYPAITEKDWLAQVRELAMLSGWLPYHTWSSMHSAAGFPDVVLVRERNGSTSLIFAELKSNTGKVSSKQQKWLDMLSQVDGIGVFVWRPSDWDEVVEVLK